MVTKHINHVYTGACQGGCTNFLGTSSNFMSFGGFRGFEEKDLSYISNSNIISITDVTPSQTPTLQKKIHLTLTNLRWLDFKAELASRTGHQNIPHD